MTRQRINLTVASLPYYMVASLEFVFIIFIYNFIYNWLARRLQTNFKR